jgi:hypothetical protein
MRRRLACLSLGLAVGCTPDLKRVHTPDLLHVPAHAAAKLGPRPPVVVKSSSVSPPSQWQVHSTLQPGAAVADGSLETVAVAANPTSKDQYVLVDLGCAAMVRQVTQHHGASETGFPRQYRVDVADEHNFPYWLQFVGPGAPGDSTATFAKPVHARFVRITLLEPCAEPWTISELTIE